MQIIYAKEDAPRQITKSIFLAGPTPRSDDGKSWRPDALSILEQQCYDGVVFVPEPRDGIWHGDYIGQVEWEEQHLNMADCIVFWVPRDMKTMPALTTNIEWGEWKDSGRVVLGAPHNAKSIRYMRHFAEKLCVNHYDTLASTLQHAIDFVSAGSSRTEGEREVPLYIWNTPHFQQWYGAQSNAGNRLDGARVVWTFRVGPSRSFVFFWALHVNMFITEEGRNRTNEVVLSRPDIATIVAYHKAHGVTRVAIIREFRSPASTKDGYIREVPGGSSWKPDTDPFGTMAHEFQEETGLAIEDTSRISFVGVRQLNGTLSAHRAYVYAIQITDKELEYLQTQQDENTVHGVEADTERTYVEVHRLRDLISSKTDALDWSMVGMILSAIEQNK